MSSTPESLTDGDEGRDARCTGAGAMTGGSFHGLSADDVKDVKFAVRRLTRMWKQRPDLSPERVERRKRLVRVLAVLNEFPGGCVLRATEPDQTP